MRPLSRSTLKPARSYQRLLTVKVRGRTTTPDRRRGRTLSPGARSAKQTTHHGPLQRLLDGGIVDGEPPRPSTYLRADASHDHAPTFLTRSSSVKVTLTRVSSLPPALASAAKR